jgi:hypothetical protein
MAEVVVGGGHGILRLDPARLKELVDVVNVKEPRRGEVRSESASVEATRRTEVVEWLRRGFGDPGVE